MWGLSPILSIVWPHKHHWPTHGTITVGSPHCWVQCGESHSRLIAQVEWPQNPWIWPLLRILWNKKKLFSSTEGGLPGSSSPTQAQYWVNLSTSSKVQSPQEQRKLSSTTTANWEWSRSREQQPHYSELSPPPQHTKEGRVVGNCKFAFQFSNTN